MGLSAEARKKAGVGAVHGIDTPESYIVENIADAKNVFRGSGYAVPISAEQVYALDPEVIILPTANGYHPPRELMESEYFKNLRELRAVMEKKVFAMPWTPMNCAPGVSP